ncbi:hypothetical protein BaRGS_00027336 [Batillaria attramentaria]|uniref:Endoglucanase n=1 Tax=Batillaria attramentaria TaxID=370345 RepID=A0ABD0K317_9CAEN
MPNYHTAHLTILALLISMATVAMGCPTECTCDTAKHQVMCTNPSLSGWPAGVPADTKTLYIKGSFSTRLQLHHINAGDLSGLTSLETLVISDTVLDSIDENAFQGLTSLRSLDMSYNRLTSIPAGLFQGLDKLTFVYLTGNTHCSLPPSVFKNLKTLRELYLGSMSISVFDPSLFSGLDSLVHLDLSDNEIKEVPASVASPTFLRSLKNLDLSFNQLTTLSNDTGQLLTRVLKVELANNPWHCNCLLKWLRGHKRHVSTPHESSNVVLCNSPEALRYRALVSIPDADFKCTPPTIVKCDSLATQYEGDSFTVSCNMTGDPFPDVSWSTADGAMTVGKPPGQPRSPQLTVKEPTVSISLKATPAINGNLTIMAQNVYGMVEETIVVVPPTEAPGCSGNNMMLFAAAGVAGVALLVSAIVTGVACKKMNSAKVGAAESEGTKNRLSRLNQSPNTSETFDLDTDRRNQERKRFSETTAFCAALVAVLSIQISEGSTGRYNYSAVLSKSLQFYLAQRSGDLPDNVDVIPWRKDSALNDGSDVNKDLEGGWYDAGDFLKLNFPMAASATNLLWGLVQFQDAYVASGKLARMRRVTKWPLDYLMKCWDSQAKELYGQVGNVKADHSYWGRPEDMTMARPSSKLPERPLLPLLPATSPSRIPLLSAARSVYDFADKYRGKYSDSISDAATVYKSNGYMDELCWGAAWLYKATGEATYKQKAHNALVNGGGLSSSEFSWDDKGMGCAVLLYELEKDDANKRQTYANAIKSFTQKWRSGNGMTVTPCGLVWLRRWDALRYALNAALIATMAAENGLEPAANRKWAVSQMNYALGDNGKGSRGPRSYVVGFGTNPPQQPHHRSSSCPLAPASCTWDDYNAAGANPHVLNGALVGGPDSSDSYTDSRQDYVMNEVAVDYNAGFQSVLAGLISLGKRGALPEVTMNCPQ